MNVKAFSKAWTALCQTKGTPQLIVPSGKKFLLMPVMFQGPCQSNSVQVQVWLVVRQRILVHFITLNLEMIACVYTTLITIYHASIVIRDKI